MNHLLRIEQWGMVRVVCTHPEPRVTVAHVHLSDSTGAFVVLDPEGADDLVRQLVDTPAGEPAVVAIDGVVLAALPAGLVDRAASKLHRAAGLARAQWREPSQTPPKFVVAGR